MNYKYFLLNVVFLLGVSPFVFVMEDKQEKDYSACNLIKQINPNASPSDYLSLAAKIHEAKLDTCQCIKYLMKQKRQKALIETQKELQEKFNIDEKKWNETEEYIKSLKQNIKQKQKDQKLEIKCDPDVVLPEELLTKIRKIYENNNIKGVLKIKYQEKLYLAAAFTEDDGTHILYFSKKFLAFKIQNGVIQHEVIHHKNYHSVENRRLVKLTPSFLENPIKWLFGNHNHGENLLSIDKSARNIHQANEAIADRLPTACGDCSVVYEMEQMTKELINLVDNWDIESLAKEKNIILTKNTPEERKNEFFKKNNYRHPTPQKRLDWVLRIKNLREAHGALKKNERENSLKMNNNLNTLLTFNPF